MKAIILAGGKGTRLAPYTTILPKPLIPVGHRPIIEIIIRQLIYFGFKDITLAVGYLAEIIQAYFQNSSYISTQDIKLNYVREDTPLGTAGSLHMLKGIKEPFLVMNGDVLTTIDFRKIFDFHTMNDAALTVAAHKRKVQIDLGVIETDSEGKLMNYLEKPSHEYLVSAGIYIYSPRVLDYIEPKQHLDFPDIVMHLLQEGEKVLSYPSEDFWLDIGKPEDYAQATEEFEKSKEQFHCE
ncbi:sugar phosphate nucleotidyltransferase [Candidatus Omnitrophota bacterium]